MTQTEPTTAIQAFEEALVTFERECMRLVDSVENETDHQMLRDIYAHLHQDIERLKGLESYLAPRLGLKKGIVAAGGGTLEPKWGAPRKEWDHQALKPLVIERILTNHVDPDTGAISAPYTTLMSEVLDAVSFSSWKVTVIRDKLGIDPDQYCKKDPARMNVIVRFPSESPIPGARDHAAASG